MLLYAYERYYRNPILENAEFLCHNIMTWDCSDSLEELAVLRQNFAMQPNYADFFFRSNGSTHHARQFGFGPHGSYWLNQIEDCVKYRQHNRYVMLYMSIFVHSYQCGFYRSSLEQIKNDTIPAHYMAFVRWERPGAVDYLIDELQKINNYALFSNPNNWLYLLSHPVFREFIQTSSLTSAMSTNWDGFYKKPPPGVHFNDNMVNWTTCMNFYTCPYGTRHFLPTFVVATTGIVNLLNLSQPPTWPIDDQMVVASDVRRCDCGKNYMPFEFVPHVEYAIRSSSGELVYCLDLANDLNALYLNLQFIQHGGTVDVLYITTDLQPDTEIITEYFAKHGLNTRFIKNHYWSAGGKLPVFWRDDTNPRQYQRFRWAIKQL